MSFCVKYNNGVSDVQDWYGNSTRQQTGTVKAADGYKITGITKAYYGNNNDITYRFRFTKISDQQYSYTFALNQREIDSLMNTSDYTVHLNVNTQKIGADPTTDLKVTYNNGLADITDTFSGQKAGTVTGTAKAGTGYIITGITGAKYNMAGGFVTVNLDNFKTAKITDTEYSYSFNLTNDNIKDINDNNLTVQLGVETEEQVEPISIDTSGLKNCSVSPTVINPDEEATVTLTADSGYILNGTGNYNADGEDTSFTCNNVASYQLTVIADSSFSISFTATKKQTSPITIDTTGLKNCTISPTTINPDKKTTITLTVDTGYILNGSGSYIIDGKTSSFTCHNVASYQLTITADSSVSISFTATKTEPKPTSIVHTYVLSQTDYNNLGKQVIAGTNSSGTAFEQYDYTKFVNYLYQFPFKIGNDITTSTNSINLGKQNLAIDCQKVTRETINIDLGSIDLTGMSTSHDYKPISITLYCPFSNNITLPTTVLNSKLNLSFTCNLKSEQATLLIKQNSNVVYSGQTNLFTDLPLYFTAGIQDTLIKQLRTSYQNTINQAYIVINYNKPITNLTSYKTNEHGLLSSYKGFTKVSRGTLKHSISTSIDSSLLTLLKQGVIIK